MRSMIDLTIVRLSFISLLCSFPMLLTYSQDLPRLMDAAEAKYHAVSSGRVNYHIKKINDVLLDTSYTHYDMYFHRQSQVQPMGVHLNLDIEGISHDGRAYHVGYLFSESVFRYLSYDQSNGKYYALDRQSEEELDGLKGHFWMLPLPSEANTHAFFRMLRRDSMALAHSTDQYWVASAGENLQVWLNKQDTLITRLIFKGKSQGIGFYSQMDIDTQQYNQIEFERPALYNELAIPDTIKAWTEEQEERPSAQDLPVGALAPNWCLLTLEGDTLCLEDLRGKVVLLDFWYVGCLPCIRAMPHLQELYEEYEDRGVVVVGFNPMGQPPVQQQDYLRERSINYPVVHSGEQKNWADSYAVAGYPTLFIIDPEGRISYRESGFVAGESQKKWRIEIEKLLK